MSRLIYGNTNKSVLIKELKKIFNSISSDAAVISETTGICVSDVNKILFYLNIPIGVEVLEFYLKSLKAFISFKQKWPTAIIKMKQMPRTTSELNALNKKQKTLTVRQTQGLKWLLCLTKKVSVSDIKRKENVSISVVNKVISEALLFIAQELYPDSKAISDMFTSKTPTEIVSLISGTLNKDIKRILKIYN